MPTQGSSGPAPRVYLIDHDPVTTFVLSDLVESIEIPYTVFNSTASFLAQDVSTLTGCLVTEVRMPEMSGLDLQDVLKRLDIALPIIFISSYPEVSSIVRAMRGGASDFFQKPFSPQQVLDRIQDGLRINKALATTRAQSRELEERMALLTPRERQLLEGIFEGRPTKAIAHDIGVSLRTAEEHRHRIMHKLKAHSLPELVKMHMRAKAAKPGEYFSTSETDAPGSHH